MESCRLHELEGIIAGRIRIRGWTRKGVVLLESALPALYWTLNWDRPLEKRGYTFGSRKIATVNKRLFSQKRITLTTNGNKKLSFPNGNKKHGEHSVSENDLFTVSRACCAPVSSYYDATRERERERERRMRQTKNLVVCRTKKHFSKKFIRIYLQNFLIF
jgi:hypothetical protein